MEKRIQNSSRVISYLLHTDSQKPVDQGKERKMDMSSKLLGNKPIMNQREACKGFIGHQRGVSSLKWKDFIIVLTTILTFENFLLYSQVTTS